MKNMNLALRISLILALHIFALLGMISMKQ